MGTTVSLCPNDTVSLRDLKRTVAPSRFARAQYFPWTRDWGKILRAGGVGKTEVDTLA